MSTEMGAGAELAGVYRRPEIPPYCLGMVATRTCALTNCSSPMPVTITEVMPHGYEAPAFDDTGYFCPTYQTATSDGRVYNKPIIASQE